MFFKYIISTLHKPFPEEENWLQHIRILVILSLFITLFLYIFQPFGISTLQSYKFLICLGFGSMTFLGALVFKLIADLILFLSGREVSRTFGTWILNIIGVMFFISLANFIFARLILFGNLDWELFPAMVYGTYKIGIIPVVMLGGFLLFKQEKKYQDIAEEINFRKTIPSNVKDGRNILLFDIPTHQIKYIEALQNYVKIAFMNQEGRLKIKTERVTLKTIIKETEGGTIIKCHRSFLVNIDVIVNTSGNAQGLLLNLSDCERTIPVSRSFVSKFRRK